MRSFRIIHNQATTCHFLRHMVCLSILMERHNMGFQSVFLPCLSLILQRHSNRPIYKLHLQLQTHSHILNHDVIFFSHEATLVLELYEPRLSIFHFIGTWFYFLNGFDTILINLHLKQTPLRYKELMMDRHKMITYNQ